MAGAVGDLDCRAYVRREPATRNLGAAKSGTWSGGRVLGNALSLRHQINSSSVSPCGNRLSTNWHFEQVGVKPTGIGGSICFVPPPFVVVVP